ncbi:MAG: hypothetical protein AABW65_02040 [Nanoarchaeota archaeon]
MEYNKLNQLYEMSDFIEGSSYVAERGLYSEDASSCTSSKASRTKSKIIHNVVIADERGFNYPIERLHNIPSEKEQRLCVVFMVI